jgi:hypothetical protein
MQFHGVSPQVVRRLNTVMSRGRPGQRLEPCECGRINCLPGGLTID